MVLPAEKSAYLKAMGITQWVLRDTPSDTPSDLPSVVQADSGSDIGGASVSEMEWPELQQVVSTCQQCTLAEARTQTVFGVGKLNANWLIIGEAPGEQEDLQGEPFVGRAGLLLNNMLAAVGLSRQSVYIANVVKCRPPGNRDPQVEEINTCSAYLKRQIELIQPNVILVVGRVAAQSLLQSETPIGKMRGQIYHYQDTNIPLIVTYHPAYLLRRPIEKRKSWEDLKLARDCMND